VGGDEPGMDDGSDLRRSVTSAHPLSPSSTRAAVAPTPNRVDENIFPVEFKIGIPADGNWDIDGAICSRYCYDRHQGEREHLVKYTKRWMDADDFGVPEDVLKAMWLKYKESVYDLDWKLSRSRAECNSTLLAHLDTVIDFNPGRDKGRYLCRWKFVWTPESKIARPDWVMHCSKERNDRTGRRCSPRDTTTSSYTQARREAMTLVNNLLETL
jgi:hypothetical protein